MITSSDTEIVIDGDVVIKLHRPGTDPLALAARLRIAARLDCLLSPLSTEPEQVGSRWRTRWPKVTTVPPDPKHVPWADAGRLLAQLHSQIIDTPLPHAGPDRLRRALDALPDAPWAVTVRRAAAGLPDDLWRVGDICTTVHGDWHLGQMGRLGHEWLLIDVDDLGVGDPAWDLDRPAGFWAAGLIPDTAWASFLDAYRDADGPAVPASGDPWPVLEPFARAAVIQAAARGGDDEASELLLEACARMPDHS